MIPKPRIVEVHMTSPNGGYYEVNTSTLKGSYGKQLDALDASVTTTIDGFSSAANIRLPRGTKLDGRTYVEMFTIQGSAGIFRARSPQIGYGGQDTNIQLEHAINELGDFMVTDKIEKEMTLEGAMKKIFSYYEDKSALWQLGSVVKKPKDPDGDEDSSEKCVLDVDWDNCLEAIRTVMEQYPYLRLDFNFNALPWKLNVVYRDQEVGAEGRLSRNVVSAQVIRDDSELFTKVYMDGYKNKDGKPGSYTSKSAVKKYGLIETYITGANDTEAIAEKTIKAYMRAHKKPKYSVSIEGLELSDITGEKLDKLTVGKKMRLALPDYGETITEHITEVSFPSVYLQPKKATVSLNDEPDKVIKHIKEAKKTASGARKKGLKKVKTKGDILELIFGDGQHINFSKAVFLMKDKKKNAGWDDGVFTVRAFRIDPDEDGNPYEHEVCTAVNTRITDIALQEGKRTKLYGSWHLEVPLRINTAVDGYTGFEQVKIFDGKPVYDKGWGDAYKEVIPAPPNQSTNTLTVKTPSATIGGNQNLTYNLRSNANDNDVAEAYSSSSLDVVATLRHGKYTAGRNATKIVGPTWSSSGASATATFTTDAPNPVSGGTASLGMAITAPTWGTGADANKCTVYLQQNDQYSTRRASREIDASARFEAGQNATEINFKEWTNGSGSGVSVDNNTAVLETNAPTPKSFNLKIAMSQDSWSNGKKHVYAGRTSTSSGNRIARVEVEATDLTVKSTISTGTPSGKSIGSVSISQLTAGTFKVASLEYCGKQVQVYFGVYA